MPALNFGTSDYVTLGYLVSWSEYANNDSYISELHEVIEDDYADELEELREEGDEADVGRFIEEKTDEYISRDIEQDYEDAFTDVEYGIADLELRFINLEAKSGYYEGAWLKITMDYSLESEDDREDLYNDIGQLGEFLNKLIDSGWREVSCSYYGGVDRSDYDDTCEAVATAIREMMEEAAKAEIYDWDEPGRDWDV